MLQDLAYGLRLLRRSPGFSLLAVFCLTLGIGSTTAVFGWIEGILLRPFPLVAGQDRLVAMAGTEAGTSEYDDVSWPDLQDLQKSCKLFDAFIVDRIFNTTLSVGDRAERALGSVVSANYFQALGVRPILGRGFEADEEVGRNAHPVTVISYQTWRERFGGDPAIIGKTQMLNGQRHTIVGVAPPGFYGTFVGYAFSFWVPASMQERFDPGGYKLEDRGARWIEGFARLKPGVTLVQAQQEISAVARHLAAAYPGTDRGRGIRLLPLWQTPFNGAATLLPTLRIALAVACLVLFIACANVGNLLLVRAFGRRQEMTVRLAVGAGRGRLLRQLFAEGLLLSLLGALGGLLAALWCRNLIVLLVPNRGVKINLPAQFDWRVLAVSAAVCALTTLLFALLPAHQSGKLDLAGAMRSDSGGVVGGRGRTWLRSGLVLVQVSLSFALLVAAGLLLRSLRGMQAIDPGFTTQGVLSTSVDLRSAGYDARQAESFRQRLTARLEALGGVESAVFSRVLPLSYPSLSAAPIAVAGYVPAPDEAPTVEYDEVGPGYLATMGIPLRAGRDLAPSDDETTAPVAVVNEAMVTRYWHGQDPVGKRLQVKGRWVQVVGVAATVKMRSVLETPRPLFYLPMRQSASGQVLNLRTRLPARVLGPLLAREVHALDPSLAPGELITMEEAVNRMSWPRRVAVALLAAFGALALVLAAIGLYGVMAYMVSQGTREMGLRMALGADARDLLRLVLARGLALTGGGVALGAALALALTRLMGDLLYRTSPRDPGAFASALLVMAGVALAACLLPAWRAMQTDPAGALRS